MLLRLGVIDIPYKTRVPAEMRRVKTRVRRNGKRNWSDEGSSSSAPSGGETTGDVAEFLERKYHVMAHFWDKYGQESCDALSQVLLNNFADMASGRNVGAPDFTAATSKMHELFNGFIDKREMDGLEPGVPTKAARLGINHSFLHPYAKGNPERPSFRDTGTYRDSFGAEIDP